MFHQLKLLESRFARYIISGVLSFIIENLSFLAFYYLGGVEVKLSNILSICIALITNFFVSKSFVFNQKYSTRLKTQLSSYLVLITFNLTISTTAVAYLVHHGIHGYLAKPAVSSMIAVWTYFIYKKIIFKPGAHSKLIVNE